MKIFVTLGFEHFSFDRLLRAVDAGVADREIRGEVLIQTGHSLYPVRFCRAQRFLRFDEIVSCFKDADIVVSHAGVGTTLLSLSAGKIPILFPRQARYHEHVDDHQIQFARMLEKRKKVLVAYDDADLLVKINRYDSLVTKLLAGPQDSLSLSLRARLEKILGSGPDEKEIVP